MCISELSFRLHVKNISWCQQIRSFVFCFYLRNSDTHRKQTKTCLNQTHVMLLITYLTVCDDSRFHVSLQKLQIRSTTCSMATQVGKNSRLPTTLSWTWVLQHCIVFFTITTTAMRASVNSPGDVRTSLGQGTVPALSFLQKFSHSFSLIYESNKQSGVDLC